MSFENEVSYLFASFLRHVSENATSYWFLILENDAPSKATAAVRQLWSEEEKTKQNNIETMNQSSLQQYGGLDRDHYIAMLLKLKLVRVHRSYAKGIIASPDVWRSFFIFHNIDAEMDGRSYGRRPFSTPTAPCMRIGRKEDQYHAKVSAKEKKAFVPPPRCGGIDDARRDLRDGLRRLLSQEDLDKRKTMLTAAAAKGKAKSSQNNSIEATNASGNNKDNGEDTPAKKLPKYPIMDMLKINPDEFSSERGTHNLKRLIGELITLQQVQSGNKNRVEFYKLQQNKPDTAVIIKSHTSVKAFEAYHRKSPYIEEVIRCMDNDESVAVKRLASYLKKKKRKRKSIDARKETSAKKAYLNNDTEVVGQQRKESGQTASDK